MAQGAELFRPNVQSAARGLPRCVSRCLHRALRPNKRRQTYSAQMLAINLLYKHLPLQGFGTTAPQQPFDNDRLHQSCHRQRYQQRNTCPTSQQTGIIRPNIGQRKGIQTDTCRTDSQTAAITMQRTVMGLLPRRHVHEGISTHAPLQRGGCKGNKAPVLRKV